MSEQEVKNDILNSLYQEIRVVEGQNLRTGKYDDNMMRKFIEKRIEMAVKKEGDNEI
ncbi:MAG: hypothetical protein IJF03_04060 [Lachnospiraceae bacterium]|nr:hypothetical protein [Lachnospiraceae bacterium]